MARRRNNFGQLMSLFNTINMVGYNASQAVIQTKAAKGQLSLEKKEMELEQQQALEELKLRDRDYALRVQGAQRQEKIYKDIAIVVGIGISAVMGIIGIGVLVTSKKERSK